MISDNETPARKAAREQLQRLAAGLAQVVGQHLEGSGIGFALVLYDFGEGGHIAYAADGLRSDVAKALRELSEKLEVDALAANTVIKTRRR